MLPYAPISPEPVVTRWRTWLEAVEYYNCYLSDIKAGNNGFPAAVSSSVSTCSLLSSVVGCLVHVAIRSASLHGGDDEASAVRRPPLVLPPLVRALAGEPSVSYYDGLNETGPWDVFFNGTTLVLSPVNASVADSGGEDERLSSLDERYDLLPLQNDSAPLLEYREPFQPLSSVDDGEARKTVYLLGLFELTGSCEAARGGRAERAAARLAIRHVNERNVVPGHRLEMYYNDTRVS
ncbi:hypothetical protein HPB52_024355 [Rhipicephalus sanguineus]|uniref:Uncharacterized protein n=1 Tax=Rhipicephalus sanguineus TaxID=34632 RepID=A0A9D4SMI8_RHISA|nr:hypothetical protein HPB52_024355 [Rhipicephalus sanguineus]